MSSFDVPVKLGEEFMQNPHGTFERIRAAGKSICRATLPTGLTIWIVVGYAEAKALLSDGRLTKDTAAVRSLHGRQVTSTGVESRLVTRALAAHMNNADPPGHTRLRGLVNKVFTPRAVSRLRPRIEQVTDDLLDRMAASGHADLLHEFAFPLPITVICELLGVPTDDRAKFQQWSNHLVLSSSSAEVEDVAADLADYLSALVSDKRLRPTQDLLSDLVHAAEGGDRLTDEELVAMAFLLLVAGHETTVNLISNGMLALLTHPDQLLRLHRDPALLPGAIEELLRYDGPVNLATLRCTTTTVEAGGVTIPPGQFVLVSLLAANRDQAEFDAPDQLDVSRPAGAHLAFGYGIHYCVAAPLARLEGEIAIGRLLDRFPTIRLATDVERLRWRSSTLMHGLAALPVTFH
nr:cytochrome P450 [Kibdelosporangium sp. MJ126-NF4]CEL13240.1 putative cytochrome P450 hydroxylase [Kibdelosporangium sp. MJ126-NF4]CTQ98931.1 putative cytochrome P450 hydroxylase [Kibdelosporangium sp. MJ126-NF4]